MSTRPLTELFGATPDTSLSWEYMNSVLAELQARIGELQVLKAGLDEAIAQAQAIAIARINEIIGPATDEINEKIAIVNALVAQAQTDLQEATADGVSLVQPLIDVAMAAVIAATGSANAAAGSANAAAATANQTAVAYANEARRVTQFTRRLAG